MGWVPLGSAYRQKDPSGREGGFPQARNWMRREGSALQTTLTLGLEQQGAGRAWA